jgi:hypothetical protein
VAEYLLIEHEALVSNPRTTKKRIQNVRQTLSSLAKTEEGECTGMLWGGHGLKMSHLMKTRSSFLPHALAVPLLSLALLGNPEGLVTEGRGRFLEGRGRQ